MPLDYIRDGDEIYRRSFATIRAEADLSRFPDGLTRVVVRMIHACGMPDLAADVVWSDDVVAAAATALKSGAPILCDSRMVADGITRARLPAGNRVICTLGAAEVPDIARRIGNTRTAAAIDLWRDDIEGAVVAIGNAPTALFRLLELLDEGWPRPIAIVGMPVGFVGAVESKEELARDSRGVAFLTVRGRRGGSAIAAAAVNALASDRE